MKIFYYYKTTGNVAENIKASKDIWFLTDYLAINRLKHGFDENTYQHDRCVNGYILTWL